jgi:hypothetical protein
VAGFVVDNMLYSYEASDPHEAHYLAALLNAPCIDAAVKPFLTKGAFGERDIHRRPFEVLPNPIPLFDPEDGRRLQLAELSRRATSGWQTWSCPRTSASAACTRRCGRPSVRSCKR